MAPQISAQAPDACAQVVEHLRAGGLVGLPTGTNYRALACALRSDAVDALWRLSPAEDRPALALASPQQVFDWLPYLRGAGLRLARRFWPGPLTLLATALPHQGLLPRLPAQTRDVLRFFDQPMALTSPDEPLARRAIRGLGLPVVLGGPSLAVYADELASAARDNLALIVDGGPPPRPAPATVVDIRGPSPKVVREGAITADAVREAGLCRIVFVCTGNTCRSPMAESICRRMLADRVGCGVGDLGRRGFVVESAGLAARSGEAASPEAGVAAAAFGGDLSRHLSQPLNYDLLANADHVFAMTRSHLRMLQEVQRDIGPWPRLLSTTGDDVDDPIGGPPETYEQCCRQIHGCLERLLPQIMEQ